MFADLSAQFRDELLKAQAEAAITGEARLLVTRDSVKHIPQERQSGSARYRLDPYTLSLSTGDKTVTFTPKEFRIVHLLLHANGRIDRDKLISRVWNGVHVGRKTLDVHLFNVRRKVAKLGLKVVFEHPNFYRICGR